MEKMHQQLVAIIRKILKEEDDRILNVRGGRGYGTGHPYTEEEQEKEEPVKISKAFKKE